MGRLTKNDKALLEYFATIKHNHCDVPFMTKIARDTGVSTATISRFATRQGHYNFSAMRASLNSPNEFKNIQFDDYGLLSFIRKSKEIYIITSKSTGVLGYHLRERLNEYNIKTNMRGFHNSKNETYSNIPRSASVILISLSGRSAWYESYIAAQIRKRSLLLSTSPPTKATKSIVKITLSQFRLKKVTKVEKNTTLRRVFEWLDDALNVLEREILQQKILENEQKQKNPG